MPGGRQAQSQSPTLIKSELADEQPQVRWGGRSTTVGNNLSTSSPVSPSWEGGTGGSARCPSCPTYAVTRAHVLGREAAAELEILGFLGCRSFGICS